MAEKMFALVGNFSFREPEGKGLWCFEFDPETADMRLVSKLRGDVGVGNTFVDRETGIVYLTNETPNQPGQLGGGGNALAFRVDKETGEMTELSEKKTLSALPCYIWLDNSKKYALVPHHIGGSVTTKVVRNDDGTFTNKTVTDDAVITLFRVNDDGSLGDVCDVLLVQSADVIAQDPDNPRRVSGIPHLHSIVGSPDGSIYISCDKGLDKVHVLKLDRENGKLIYMSTFDAESRTAPRYSVFHPTKPYLFANNETKTYIHAFKYDGEAGKLELIAKADLFPEHGAEGMPSDITISKDGSYLYAATRGVDMLSVFSVGEDGVPTLIQNISCGGKGPRGIKLSPDGRFLLSANLDSKEVAVFSVGGDGKLTDTGKRAEASFPGNIAFMY